MSIEMRTLIPMNIPETWFVKMGGKIYVHLKYYTSTDAMTAAVRELSIRQCLPIVIIVPLPTRAMEGKPVA